MGTSKGYPFPSDLDAADVPYDIELLAQTVDSSPGIASLSQAQIDALGVDLKWAGRVVWNQTSNVLQVSNGSVFSDVAVVPSNSTPNATAGTGVSGTSATVSRSDHVHALHAHNHDSSTSGGVLSTPLVNDANSSRTLQLSDAGKLIRMTNSAATTVTVPHNDSVQFPTGTTITVLYSGGVSNICTLSPGSGVTLNGTPGLKLRTQWSAATLIKLDTNTWVASGDLQP
jgi:hypothetical protein